MKWTINGAFGTEHVNQRLFTGKDKLFLKSNGFGKHQFDTAVCIRWPENMRFKGCIIDMYIINRTCSPLLSRRLFIFSTQFIKIIIRYKRIGYNKSLFYDVAVIQWITSCHKNRLTTRAITL